MAVYSKYIDSGGELYYVLTGAVAGAQGRQCSVIEGGRGELSSAVAKCCRGVFAPRGDLWS